MILIRNLLNYLKLLNIMSPEVKRMLEYELSGRDIFEEYKNYTAED